MSQTPTPLTMRTHGVALPWARRAPATWARALYARGALRVLRALFAPTTVEGRSVLDDLAGVADEHPVVFVANHTSHSDTMVLMTTLPERLRRRLVVAAAADYFFTNRFTALFSTACIGAIPVDRSKVNRTTLELCHELLGDGHSLLIYPEGGRSAHPEEMATFKPGAAWIARRATVDVVPVHLSGTADVLPKGRVLPRRHPVRVRFGTPLRCGEDEDARAFNRRIEAAVRALGGAFIDVGSESPQRPFDPAACVTAPPPQPSDAATRRDDAFPATEDQPIDS